MGELDVLTILKILKKFQYPIPQLVISQGQNWTENYFSKQEYSDLFFYLCQCFQSPCAPHVFADGILYTCQEHMQTMSHTALQE